MKLKQITTALDVEGIKYKMLDAGGGKSIVVTERGGRIFGVYTGEEDEGIFWVPQCFEDTKLFADYLESGAWNMGGDRIWIAPELQFSVKDRKKFWETLKTPTAVDPGNWHLTEENDGVVLRQDLRLQAAVIAQGEISLSVKRTVRRAENPLRKRSDFSNLMDGLNYSGYEQLLEISGSGDSSIAAECWNLLQVIPGGNIYIPMYTPSRGVDYYEPATNFETLTERCVTLKSTGINRYKVGYKAADVMGRIAYAFRRKDDCCCLLVRNFPNNPSALYREEPPLMEGENGFSVHVYNDDGNSGSFTEIECNLQSIGVPTGYSLSADRVSTWVFYGMEDKLNAVAQRLLGFGALKYEA
ncbi:MAG: DUF6786 family protein [Oscillospiraceae bacterium]